MFRKSALIAAAFAACSVLANPMQPDRISAPVVKAQPAAVTPKPPPIPKLEDILIIGALKKATFSGAGEVIPGEMINGYELINIEPQSVTLQRGNRTYLLTLTASGEFNITPITED